MKYNTKNIKNRHKILCYKAIILVENVCFSRKDLGTLHRLPSLHDLKMGWGSTGKGNLSSPLKYIQQRSH